jgi:hypothetical protein
MNSWTGRSSDCKPREVVRKCDAVCKRNERTTLDGTADESIHVVEVSDGFIDFASPFD